MQISELESKLQIEGLTYAHVDGILKHYISGEKVYSDNKWKNHINVFGIYRGQDGVFCFFITDSERGIREYSDIFSTEEEACEALLIHMAMSERIYQKRKGKHA